jgi:hypothetical protein
MALFLTYLGVVARRGFFLWYYLRLTPVLSHSDSSFFTSVYWSSRTAERFSVSFDVREIYGKNIALFRCCCKSWNFNEHFSWKLLALLRALTFAFLLGSCALCVSHWTRTQVRKIRLDFILFKFDVPNMEFCFVKAIGLTSFSSACEACWLCERISFYYTRNLKSRHCYGVLLFGMPGWYSFIISSKNDSHH